MKIADFVIDSRIGVLDRLLGFAYGAARGLLGEASVEEVPAPIMGAEDFSYVLQQVPGAMFFIGARHASVPPEEAQANHSNKVVFEEAAMAAGARLCP